MFNEPPGQNPAPTYLMMYAFFGFSAFLLILNVAKEVGVLAGLLLFLLFIIGLYYSIYFTLCGEDS